MPHRRNYPFYQIGLMFALALDSVPNNQAMGLNRHFTSSQMAANASVYFNFLPDDAFRGL